MMLRQFLSKAKAAVVAHPLRTAAGVVGILVFGGIGYAVFGPEELPYLTAQATRKDLRQTVEVVGTVTSERALELTFPMNGIIASVRVKEGDEVTAGQILAELRAGNRSAGVALAQARVLSAQADLQELREGSRPEDIAVVEAELRSKQASLAAAETSLENAERILVQSLAELRDLESEANVSLAGSVSTSASATLQEIADAKNALFVVDGVFRNNQVQDAIEKDDPGGFKKLQRNIATASDELDRSAALPRPTDIIEAQAFLAAGQEAVRTAAMAINAGYDLLLRVRPTSSFTESTRETHKNTIATQSSSAQSSLDTLATEMKTLQDASAGLATRIESERTALAAASNAKEKALVDIASYEAGVAIAQAQLRQKQAPARSTDIAWAEAQVRQAQAELARSRADLDDMILRSPVDGTVTNVEVKAGELAPAGPAITMLGSSPYRVEALVPEVDISRVAQSQSGAIEIDAFQHEPLSITVSAVDGSPTAGEGGVKYKVTLDFLTLDPRLKIGMTGDVTIVTGVKSKVLAVPRRSVLQRENGEFYVRVPLEDDVIDQRTVQIGLEGEDGDVEIVSGLTEGDTVIVLQKQP